MKNMNQEYLRVIKKTEHIDKLKKQIIRIAITKSDLEICMKVLKELIMLFSQNCDDPVKLEALSVYAIICYARCFNSNFNFPISPDIYQKQKISSVENEISERQFHFLLMNYRNDHIAHSGKSLKAYDVGAFVAANSNLGIGTVVASRAPVEDMHFYQSMQLLVNKALDVMIRKEKDAIDNLLAHLTSDNTLITDKAMTLKPIPSDPKDIKKMWGIKD